MQYHARAKNRGQMMTDLEDIADRLNRTIKIALDTGEASSIEEAERIFALYRLQIVVGPEAIHSPVSQAALLTAINCAARTFLGGVTVVGATGLLRVVLPPFVDLEQAVLGLGGRLVQEIAPETPTLVIGDINDVDLDRSALRVTFSEWCGGVVPIASKIRLAEGGTFTPAGVLAGALGVSEIFQRLRGGTPMACRRA